MKTLFKILIIVILIGAVTLGGLFAYRHFKKPSEPPAPGTEQPGTETPGEPEEPVEPEEPTEPEEPGEPEEPDEPTEPVAPTYLSVNAEYVENANFSVSTGPGGISCVTASRPAHFKASEDTSLHFSNLPSNMASMSFTLNMTGLTENDYYPEVAFIDNTNNTFLAVQFCSWHQNFVLKLISTGGLNVQAYIMTIPEDKSFTGDFKISLLNDVLTVYLNGELVINQDITTYKDTYNFYNADDVAIGLRKDDELDAPTWSISNVIFETTTQVVNVTEYNDDGTVSFNMNGCSSFLIASAFVKNANYCGFAMTENVSLTETTLTGNGASCTLFPGITEEDVKGYYKPGYSATFTYDDVNDVITIDTSTLPIAYSGDYSDFTMTVYLIP